MYCVCAFPEEIKKKAKIQQKNLGFLLLLGLQARLLASTLSLHDLSFLVHHFTMFDVFSFNWPTCSLWSAETCVFNARLCMKKMQEAERDGVHVIMLQKTRLTDREAVAGFEKTGLAGVEGKFLSVRTFLRSRPRLGRINGLELSPGFSRLLH